MGTDKLAQAIVYLVLVLFTGEVIYTDYAQAHGLTHETPVWIISLLSGGISGGVWWTFRRKQGKKDSEG